MIKNQMTTLTVYNCEDEDGKIKRYFIGREIASLIGIKNPGNCLGKILEKDKICFRDFTGDKNPKQDPRIILVTENGVSDLIIRTVVPEDAYQVLEKYNLCEQYNQDNEKSELTTYSYISNHLCFEYFVGFEVAALLDYKNINQTIGNVSKCNKLLFRDYPGVRVPPLPPKTILLTRDGVIEILIKTRKLISVDVAHLLKKFGIEITNKKCLTKEQNTLSDISKIFKIEKIETQYPVGKYFLDMYFPEYKIIVECDELGHFDRDPTEEKERVDYINTFLDIDDTHWVRFNPDKEDFQIAQIVGEIYMTISRLKDGKIFTKACRICKEEKVCTEFYRSKISADGYNTRCKICQNRISEKIVSSKKTTVETLLQNKMCIKCEYQKSPEEFHKSKASKDGHCAICKICDSESRKEKSKIEKSIPTHKKCSRCEEVKKSCDFFGLSTSKDGLNGRCKECMKKRTNEWLKKSYVKILEKECSKCGETKDAKDFYKNVQSRDGHYSKCKICMNSNR
jgi:very-short-patch-repair endonuclease